MKKKFLCLMLTLVMVFSLVPSAVGKAIRDLRKEKGISQDVLSGFAGIARTHLTMIENGTKQANFETLWKIALALDIRPSELDARIEREIVNGIKND